MTSWSVFCRFLTARREGYNGPLQVNRLLGLEYYLWKECKWFHISSAFCKRDKKPKLPQFELLDKKRSLPVVKIWNGMTVQELANALECDPANISIPGLEGKLHLNSEISSTKTMSGIASGFGRKTVVVVNPNKINQQNNKQIFSRQPPPKPENLVKRPPVVTIMGHVDHGKTTLLDALRNTFVVDEEFGGITQHIGAFSVQVKGEEKITFIDTPGHAAFTAMRSRGAEVTDFVVLVIAADDGVMEQTVESIRIINKAGVPIIVAVNKIDKPTALKIDDIKTKLLEEGVQVEDRGGDVQLVPISALKKINLDLLVETILLQAELLNLKGDPKGLVEGVIIESKLEKLGIAATLIVKRGTLKKGKILIAGTASAKVRFMLDENRKEYKEAPPSTPVQIYGWKTLPSAGEEVFEVQSEREAARIIKHRHNELMLKKQEEDLKAVQERASLHQEKHYEESKIIKSFETNAEKRKFLFERNLRLITDANKEEEEGPFINLILKGDVHGTLEVLMDVLATYEAHDQCKLSVISAGVGHITQSDLELAETFNAIIYAFNVDIHEEVKKVIKDNTHDIRNHNVLYKLIDDLKDELNSRLPPKDTEEIQGEAEVIQHFDITHGKKKVPVAGCKCTLGVLKRESLYRVKRGEEIIYEGKLTSMKHLKNEVKTIHKSKECGLMLESFPGPFKSGDIIICYDMVKVPQKTSWDPGF